MDSLPKRPNITHFYRHILSFLETKIILPNINPSYYQLLGIILSICYLFLSNRLYKIIAISFILLTDWFDGATARRFKLISKQGYVIDVTMDRISEGLIFIKEINSSLGFIFFLLWIVNVILSFYSIKTNKHASLALRFAYLILLII